MLPTNASTNSHHEAVLRNAIETALRTFTKCSVAQMISEQNVASISGYRLDVSLRYVIQKQTIEEGLKVMVSQYWKVILGLDDHEAFMLHICDLCDLYHDPFGETSISPHRSYPCGDRTSVVKSVGIPGWNPGTETVPVAKKHIQISDFCWRPISYPCRHVSAFEIHQLYQNSGISMHHFVVFCTPEIKVLMKIPETQRLHRWPCHHPSHPKRIQLAPGVVAKKKVWLTKKALGCSGDMDMSYVYCLVISLAIDWCIHGILLYHLFKISWNLCKYVCIEIERGREKERKRERGR